ncbi:hypothetical protein HU200_018852 [Digitaria exilis]|uniref:Uncharacterized protein n=1 Tax=Digitaria exilis TaxID=1010633 RepID=A0A835F4K0_9POAL|nr:hypothetical protein HU200_018852 [Digitaria exilis]
MASGLPWRVLIIQIDLPKGTVPGRGSLNYPVVLDGVVHWLIYPLLTTTSLTTSSRTTSGRRRWGPSGSERIFYRPSGPTCPPGVDAGREAHLCVQLYMQGFTVSVLVLSAGGDWERHVEVDTRDKVSSLMTEQDRTRQFWLTMESSGDQRTGAVLKRLMVVHGQEQLLVIDLETKQVRGLGNKRGIPYELDLASRLSAAKIFCPFVSEKDLILFCAES